MSSNRKEEDPAESSSDESGVVYTYTLTSEIEGAAGNENVEESLLSSATSGRISDYLDLSSMKSSPSSPAVSSKNEETRTRSRVNSGDSSQPILTPDVKKKRGTLAVNNPNYGCGTPSSPQIPVSTQTVQQILRREKSFGGTSGIDDRSPLMKELKDSRNRNSVPLGASAFNKQVTQDSGRVLSWPLAQQPQFEEPPPTLNRIPTAPAPDQKHTYVNTVILTPVTNSKKAPAPNPRPAHTYVNTTNQESSGPAGSQHTTIQVDPERPSTPHPRDPAVKITHNQLPRNSSRRPENRVITIPQQLHHSNQGSRTTTPSQPPPHRGHNKFGRIDQTLPLPPPPPQQQEQVVQITRTITTVRVIPEKTGKERLSGLFNLLKVVGLEPWYSADVGESGSKAGWRCASRFYVILLVVLLFGSYLLHVNTCFRRDTGFNYKSISNPPQTRQKGRSSRKSKVTVDLEQGGPLHHQSVCEGNIIYVAIIPILLHFLAFVFMFFVNWRKDGGKRLGDLMNKVSSQLTREGDPLLTSKILKGLRVRMWIGYSWVIFAAAGHMMNTSLGKIFVNEKFENSEGSALHGTLVALFILSGILQDAIQAAIVVTYVTHSYLIRIHTDLIRKQTLKRSISLQEFEKATVELRDMLRFLNENVSFALAPLLLIDAIYAGGSYVKVIQMGGQITTYALIVRIFVALVWLFVSCFPLLQAANLSKSCDKLRNIAQDMRLVPRGHHPIITIAALDSLSLFLHTVKLKAKIVRVSVTLKTLVGAAVVIFLVTFLSGYF